MDKDAQLITMMTWKRGMPTWSRQTVGKEGLHSNGDRQNVQSDSILVIAISQYAWSSGTVMRTLKTHFWWFTMTVQTGDLIFELIFW